MILIFVNFWPGLAPNTDFGIIKILTSWGIFKHVEVVNPIKLIKSKMFVS